MLDMLKKINVQETKMDQKIYFILSVLFFVSIYLFQYWLKDMADYPYEDEYYSLLAALKVSPYSHTAYVKMLSAFSYFFGNFSSLYNFNFFASHLLLCASFFSYHLRRNISFATNFLFTAIVGLSPFNIVLSRKMHFWGAGFFFSILFLSTYFDGKRRHYFLVCALFLLGIFRVEFMFSAVCALGFAVSYKKSGKSVYISIGLTFLGFFLLVFLIRSFMPGMRELLSDATYSRTRSNDVTYLEAILSIMTLTVKNIPVYFYPVMEFFTSTLKLYGFVVINAFALLFFMLNPIKKNIMHLYETYKNDFLIFYFPALLALMAIRYLETYIIMFHVLFLSVLAFVMNSRRNRFFPYVIFVLVTPVFLLNLPDFSQDFKTNFWFKRIEFGQINRYLHFIVENLPKSSPENPYRILSYGQIEGVYPDRGHKYFLLRDFKEICAHGPVEFDVVLITSDREIEFKRDCILAATAMMEEKKLNENAKLYTSLRVDPNILLHWGANRVWP